MMILLFAEVLFQEAGEKVDKGMNVIFGKPLAEEIGKFRTTSQLQKSREGLLVQLVVQAKTNLLGVNGHKGGKEL